MGIDKGIVCRDCDEITQLDKVPFPSYWEGIDTEEWFNAPNYRYQAMKLITFVANHEGHNLVFLTEASRHQAEYFKLSVENDKIHIDRKFDDVKQECDWNESE